MLWRAFSNLFEMFDLQDLEISKNNKSILNSGYLPTISTVAGANYQLANSVTGFQGAINPNTGEPRPDIEINESSEDFRINTETDNQLDFAVKLLNG